MLKNIMLEENFKEYITQINSEDMIEVYSVKEEDLKDKEKSEFLRETLDYSGELNIGAASFSPIYDMLKDKYDVFIVNGEEMYTYYLFDKKTKQLCFDGELVAEDLYEMLYKYINNKIENKEPYDKVDYADAICQISSLGRELIIDKDRYTVLIDNGNSTFFGIKLSEDNIDRIVKSNNENFYSDKELDFDGVFVKDSSYTWDIVYKLANIYPNQQIVVGEKKYGECEKEFLNSIVMYNVM